LPEQREEAVVVRALKMGCLALFARALVTKSTPNLELSFFAMAGIVAGLSAAMPRKREPHAGLRASGGPRAVH
jgi:hypothetical protein